MSAANVDLQVTSKSFKRASKMLTHGRRRDAEQRRNLGLGPVERMHQQHHGALLFGQYCERRDQSWLHIRKTRLRGHLTRVRHAADDETSARRLPDPIRVAHLVRHAPQPTPVLPRPTERIHRRLAPIGRAVRGHQSLQQTWLDLTHERSKLGLGRAHQRHLHQPYDHPAHGKRDSDVDLSARRTMRTDPTPRPGGIWHPRSGNRFAEILVRLGGRPVTISGVLRICEV